MKFNTSKNKIEKIGKNQGDLDNVLIQKENELKELRPSDTIIKTSKILFESGYQIFSTNTIFGGLTATPIDMPIAADFISFTGTLNISERLIPYIKHKIVVKKPIVGDIRGVYVANITGYDSNPSVQTGTFRANATIFRRLPGGGLVIVGNTGSGEGTGEPGDVLVTVTTQPLFVIDQQRSVYSQDSTFSLGWTKVSNNLYNFSMNQRVMFVVPSENVGTIVQEGDLNYTGSHFPDEEDNILFYVVVDNRVPVTYDAYSPIEADIEAKLILSIPPINIWENFSQYKS